MEGQKKPNWADESDEELSEHEDRTAAQPKSHNPAPDQKKDILLSRIKESSFPLTLELGNLSFKVSIPVLSKELGIPESSITYIYEDERFTGNASVRLENAEEALLVGERAYTELFGRIAFVNFPRGYGPRTGNRGREGRGDRRGERSGQRRGGRQGGYRDRPQFERNFEPRANNAEKNAGRIIIAREKNPEDTTDARPQQARPKSNPFGQAKPIDTLNKDLEFEKSMEEARKASHEEGHEEKKQHRPKEEHLDEKKDQRSREVQGDRHVEAEGVQTESKEPVASEEHRQESSYERRGNYRGQGRGRGRTDRYRKRYDQEERQDVGEYEESGEHHEGKKRYNQEKQQEGYERHGNYAKSGGEWVRGEVKEGGEGERSAEVHEEAEKGVKENRSREYQGGQGYQNRDYGNKGQFGRGRGKNEGKYPEESRNYQKDLYKSEEQTHVKRPVASQNNAPRSKAWTNTDEAAEIIKKPKDTPIVEPQAKPSKYVSSYTKVKQTTPQ